MKNPDMIPNNNNIQIFIPTPDSSYTYNPYPEPTHYSQYQETWDLKTYIRIIQIDPEAKKICYGLFMVLLYSIISIYCGWSNSSLGLVSSGFYSFYDATILFTSLLGLLTAKRSPVIEYSYGFDRMEILTTFSNACLLVFISLYIFFESIEHMFQPPVVNMNTTFYVSFIGIIIHAVVSVFYRDYIKIRVESAINDSDDRSFILQVMSDVVVSLGVFLSSWIVIFFEWNIADPATSLLISIYIASKVVPILIATGKVLLQTVPTSIINILERNITDVNVIDGVHGVIAGKTHFWTYSPGVFVGTIHVKVNYESEEQHIRRKIQEIFAPYVKHLTVQIEKWDDVLRDNHN